MNPLLSDELRPIVEQAVEWRRTLHENPQTKYEEKFAASFIAKKLTEWGIEFEQGIAKTGIVGTIEGQRTSSGRAIALRADMDALDVTEESGLAYASKNPGKMHACGHDGHMASLLAAARYLKESRRFDGRVHLIFQPAEEGGRGAFKMMDEGLFERFPCDSIYGYHNWPLLPRGTFAICEGPMLAGGNEFTIEIVGEDGHAGGPHLTKDPVVIGSQLVVALQSLVSRETDPQDPAVVSITVFQAGSQTNQIAKTAILRGTIRAFKPETMKRLEDRLREMSKAIAAGFGARAIVDPEHIKHIVSPTVNKPKATKFCRKVAGGLVGQENVKEFTPIMGGEDFSGFLERKPGAFMMIGQGEPDNPKSHCSQDIHKSSYDFNDAILPLAAGYFASLVETAMPLDAAKS